MPVTIKDVARESGVNISTVSRALNDEYGVHPETREHVIAVANRLKYRPNRVARGLVTGRSSTIGLIISDIRNPFFAEVVRGAEDAARAAGCDLVLCNSDLDPKKQLEYVHSLLGKHVDGILMNSIAVLNRAQQQELARCPAPIVLLNGANSRKVFSTVCADNTEGGGLAAKYLLDLGHEDIGHISGPRHSGNLTDRARGFFKTLGSETPVVYGENTLHGGYDSTRQLLREHPNLTAVFAANDIMAFGALRAIHESGRRIPQDISVIGFDNIELASAVYPPLTTIHQPKYEIGKTAVETILARSKDADEPPVHRVLDVQLIERQSCQRRNS